MAQPIIQTSTYLQVQQDSKRYFKAHASDGIEVQYQEDGAGKKASKLVFEDEKFEFLIDSVQAMEISTANNIKMNKDIDVNGKKIRNLPSAVDNDEPYRKDQVDTALALKQDLLGSGDLDLQSNHIVNLADPVNDQDGATKKFVVDQIAAIVIDNNNYNAATHYSFRQMAANQTASDTTSLIIFPNNPSISHNGSIAGIDNDGIITFTQGSEAPYPYLYLIKFVLIYKFSQITGSAPVVKLYDKTNAGSFTQFGRDHKLYQESAEDLDDLRQYVIEFPYKPAESRTMKLELTEGADLDYISQYSTFEVRRIMTVSPP